MSKIGGEIIDGLRDALKYAEGETKGNKEHRVRHWQRLPPLVPPRLPLHPRRRM